MTEFPHQLTVNKIEQIRVPGGGYEDGPVFFKDVEECFVTPITGSQLYQAMQTTDQTDYEVYMPYELSDGITSAMQFEHDGFTLNIVGPPRDLGGQKETVLFTCKLID